MNNKAIKLRRSCTRNGKKGNGRKLDADETSEEFIEKRKVTTKRVKFSRQAAPLQNIANFQTNL